MCTIFLNFKYKKCNKVVHFLWNEVGLFRRNLGKSKSYRYLVKLFEYRGLIKSTCWERPTLYTGAEKLGFCKRFKISLSSWIRQVNRAINTQMNYTVFESEFVEMSGQLEEPGSYSYGQCDLPFKTSRRFGCATLPSVQNWTINIERHLCIIQ